MTLVVDVGNTRLKWARAGGSDLTDKGDAIYPRTAVQRVLDERWASLVTPERVLVCNVAGALIAEGLSAWVRARWGCPIDFVVPRSVGCGVTNGYRDPTSLGADRWAALIAAHRRFPLPVCVVDCGTAITIDVLAAGGQHLGGLILPGLALMRQSLFRNTEGIPEVQGGSVSALASTTNDAVAAGTFYAAVALVDRVVAEVEATLMTAVTCVVCGGDGRRLAPYFARSAVDEPDLVLLGTAIIAEGRA